MTKPKVPKQSKKPAKQVKAPKYTRRRAQVRVIRAEKGLEVKEEETFPVNKPVGTIYIPTGSKSSWIKQKDEVWKEVKNEG